MLANFFPDWSVIDASPGLAGLAGLAVGPDPTPSPPASRPPPVTSPRDFLAHIRAKT